MRLSMHLIEIKKMISKLCQAFLLMLSAYSFSQNYWQQAVDYKMVVDMNVDNFTYVGEQQLIYTNNPLMYSIKFFIIYILMLSSQVVKWLLELKMEMIKIHVLMWTLTLLITRNKGI